MSVVELNSLDSGTTAQEKFREGLAKAFVEAKINHSQGDIILRFLHSHACHDKLPLKTKTLLKTPRQLLVTIAMAPGEYYHIGFEKQLRKKLNSLPIALIPAHLVIDIHTDGMSVHRSNCIQLWPLQFRIINIVNDKPLIIGVYQGNKKPPNNVEFFEPFINEYQAIVNSEGMLYDNKRIPIHIRAFVADAPARALILNHKGHTATNPCSKCKVTGKYIDRRMTFCEFPSELRTDVEYLNSTDKRHHHAQGESALKKLNFPMVTRVPFEYMHLICLGVMKKFLSAIVSKKYAHKGLKKSEVAAISSRLLVLQKYTCSEFARRPRPLTEYANYKATEFRLMLLYLGPVIFHGILDTQAYFHFLLLHTACRCILVSNTSETQLQYAEKAFQLYVQLCENIYGKSYISFNVHGLLHVVQDVRCLGNANSFSAFPYEDNMSFFRRCLRKSHQLLQQLSRRLSEEDNFGKNTYEIPQIKYISEHHDGPTMQGFLNVEMSQYKEIKFQHFRLTCQNDRDGCIILKNGMICELVNIIKFGPNQIVLILKRYLSVDNFYNVPLGIPSSFAGIYMCKCLSSEIIAMNCTEMLAKCLKMPCWQGSQIVDDTYVAATLLSTL